ncbi:hypothetical protein EZS27_027187 [termite gut metagenome]|uniref:Uncharacterized protein n=1 Tax=termite gut metagenome TaxID=433724 RepID=A0A5J4QS39_9ZZZZ
MKIQIDRELKIKLPQALKSGCMETTDFPEITDCLMKMPDDISSLITDEEREVLLRVGERILNNPLTI